jgi:hypothetical protein
MTPVAVADALPYAPAAMASMVPDLLHLRIGQTVKLRRVEFIEDTVARNRNDGAGLARGARNRRDTGNTDQSGQE